MKNKVNFLHFEDFYEGIRAAVVDKDKKPCEEYTEDKCPSTRCKIEGDECKEKVQTNRSINGNTQYRSGRVVRF